MECVLYETHCSSFLINFHYDLVDAGDKREPVLIHSYSYEATENEHYILVGYTQDQDLCYSLLVVRMRQFERNGEIINEQKALNLYG
jgi:hypothetical protein